MKEIVLIGGGGHCKACIDVIEQQGVYSIAGIVDLPINIGKDVMGYPIIGSDKDIDKLMESYNNFFITIGQLTSATLRLNLYNKIKNSNKYLPVIISPFAYTSKYASIGEGTIIMHGAIVNANASIANNCIINTAAIIEHDVNIGAHSHISTSTTVNGGVEIGEECFIASNVVLRERVRVGNNVVVGIGSVLINDAIEEGTYFGSPARFIK